MTHPTKLSRVLPLGILTITLTACGGSSGTAASSAAQSSVASAPSPSMDATAAVSETDTATPSESAPQSATLRVGDVQSLSIGSIQVLQVKSQRITFRDQPNTVTVLVRTCNTSSDSIDVSWQPWSVSAPDDEQIQASSSSYDNDPKPAYPSYGSLAAGKCVKGWIVFEAEKPTTATAVQYTADDGGIATWKV